MSLHSALHRTFSFPGIAAFVACATLILPFACAQDEEDADLAPASVPASRRVSPGKYHQHVEALQRVVATCRQVMTPDACQSQAVGPDDRVATPAGERSVEYEWLRNTLRAASAASSAKDPKKATESSLESLGDAGQRLDEEKSAEVTIPGNDLRMTRKTLSSILARDEFAHVKPPSVLEKVRDTFLEWLSGRLQHIGRGNWSRLMTNLLFVSAIAIACAALVWWFMRQVARRSVALSPPPASDSGAPSARDWQLWLEDARRHARQGLWREAIHDMYWGAISQSESKGLWPADRARTPREYLSLLGENESRRDLAFLTRSFERTWYGGRIASQQDFEDAQASVDRLASR